jgi:hypothetical protein
MALLWQRTKRPAQHRCRDVLISQATSLVAPKPGEPRKQVAGLFCASYFLLLTAAQRGLAGTTKGINCTLTTRLSLESVVYSAAI